MLMKHFSTFIAGIMITIFGHLLYYRNTLDEHRRCSEGNPESFWLFYLIDSCEFDMCLINWRMLSFANCLISKCDRCDNYCEI
jgi:hypothetical protein